MGPRARIRRVLVVTLSTLALAAVVGANAGSAQQAGAGDLAAAAGGAGGDSVVSGTHHAHVTVTGADVAGPAVNAAGVPAKDAGAGVAAPAAKQPPAAAGAPAGAGPNLLDDLISAASGESNGTIASVLDKALAKEFEAESKTAQSNEGKTFNKTVASEEAKVETVVRISAGGKSSRDKDEAAASSVAAGGATSGSGGVSSTAADDGSKAAAGGSAAGSAAGSGSGAAAALAGGGASKRGKRSGAGGAAHSAAGSPGAGPKTGASNHTSSASSSEDVPSVEKGVDRIIDSHDNEFVLSSLPKDRVATLTLDPLLIQDLTFLFASAAVMGMVFEALKQPVINGYLVAGALVGPGGLQLIKELVQVESLAQLGVQLLLFHLGRELSFAKLRAVWSVALVGGMLQIVALSALGGIIAAVMESPVTQGIFVGALLSMSSTSVIVKCLESYRMNGTAFGQITIGTLILQDCSVGIMFALMPAFGAAAAGQAVAGTAAGGATAAAAAAAAAADGNAALLGVAVLVARVLLKLLLLVLAAGAVARLVLPLALRLLTRCASNELVQLSLVSMCLCSAWLCGRLGLSEELGAFVAGAMMCVAEQRLASAAHSGAASSTPRTPGSKGHMSEPDSPREHEETRGSLPPGKGGGLSTAASKHNGAAAAYYRHATQRQQQQRGGGGGNSHYHSEPAEVGDALITVQDADGSNASLSSHLHALQQQQQQQQQQQALLAAQPAGVGGGPACCTGGGGSGLGAASAGGVHAGDSGEQQGPHGGSVCASIQSIQNVLTALFVASMGLIMSPVFLWHHAAVLLCGTLVVTVAKAAVVTGVVRMFGVPMRLSACVGLSMAHIGEFSFVLLSMAQQLKLLSTQVYMLLLGVTAMSLLTTPFVFLATVTMLGKDNYHQLCIAGPRLRLSSSCGSASDRH